MAITLVQSDKIDTDATGTTQAKAFPSNPTAGNFLMAIFGWGTFAATDPDTPTSVVDTLGNTWTQLDLGWESSIQTHFGIWYVKNCIGGGADTVTITLPISRQARALIIAEFAGVDPTTPIQQHAVSVGVTTSGTDGEVGPSRTTTVDGCMIVGALGWGQSATAAAGTGQTEIQNTGNTFNTRLEAEYKLQASQGAVTPTWTVSVGSIKKVSFTVALAPAPPSSKAFPFQPSRIRYARR